MALPLMHKIKARDCKTVTGGESLRERSKIVLPEHLGHCFCRLPRLMLFYPSKASGKGWSREQGESKQRDPPSTSPQHRKGKV